MNTSNKVSARVNKITVSATKEMPVFAARIGGCVSLGQGVPSFPTPEHIVDAVCKALREEPRSGKYSLQHGMEELRRSLADYLREYKGINVDPEREVSVTVGAMEALLSAIMTVVDRGDEVILPSPRMLHTWNRLHSRRVFRFLFPAARKIGDWILKQ